ncbi:MAG: SRPBCC family protein [Caldilineaceae bacterium]
MAEFSATEWIAASPEEVFAFIGDVNHFAEVMSNVVRSAQITAGPVGLGTRFRETRLIQGREATAEIEVTGYEPPRRYAATSVANGITVTYHYTFTPEKAGTRVTLHAEATAGGLKKLVLPLVISFMKREDGDHLQQLKAAVERHTAVPVY